MFSTNPDRPLRSRWVALWVNLTIGVFLLASRSSAAAQGRPVVLTIRAALAEALQHNPALHALKYEPAAAQADEITADLNPNPSLTLNADLLPSEGLNPKEKNYGISVAWPFELGGKRAARVASAEAQTAVTSLHYEDAIRQTRLAVQLAYIDFLSTTEKVTAAKENLVLLDSLVELSKVRVAFKDVAPVELNRTEVERDRFKLDLAAAEQDHRAATTVLLALLGREVLPAPRINLSIMPDTTIFQRALEGMKLPLPSLDSLSTIAEQSRSDLRALRASEKAAAANLDLQKSLSSIDLSVSLDYFRSQEITYYGTTLSFPLPIFNRNQGEITKAGIQKEEAAKITDAAIIQLHADLSNAYSDVVNKQYALNTLSESVLDKSRRVRDAVDYSYRHGSTSLVDFLDAARTYNELRQSYVEALSEYAKSLITLNAVVGKEVFNEFN